MRCVAFVAALHLLLHFSPIPLQHILSGDRPRGAPVRRAQIRLVIPPGRPDFAPEGQRAGQPRHQRQVERLVDDAAARLRQCRMGPTLRRNHIPRARRLRQLRHLLPQVVLVLRLGLHRHPDRSTHCGDYSHRFLDWHDERTITTGNQVGTKATD